MHRSPRRQLRVVRPFLLLTLLILSANVPMTFAAAVQPQLLVAQGQRAFERGNFSEAAVQWQQALEVYQKQGNTNAVIDTSVSLASALQSAGQQRRAVEILTD